MTSLAFCRNLPSTFPKFYQRCSGNTLVPRATSQGSRRVQSAAARDDVSAREARDTTSVPARYSVSAGESGPKSARILRRNAGAKTRRTIRPWRRFPSPPCPTSRSGSGCARRSAPGVPPTGSTPWSANFCFTSGIAEDLVEFRVQLGEHVGRRPGRRHDPEPHADLVTGHAGFRDGRDIGQRGGARQAR